MDPIKECFQKVCEQARLDGAEAELLISSGENISLKYSQKRLEKFESSQTQMAGFRVIREGSQGYAYTENLSSEALMLCYREALNNAKTLQSSSSQAQIPLVTPDSSGVLAKNLGVLGGLLLKEEISMADKIEVARRLEEDCLTFDSRVQSVPYGGFNESVSRRRILNSKGLDQEFAQSYYTGYAYPLAKQGEASKMNGDSFFERKFQDIKVKATAQSAVEKTVALLGAVKLKTGNYSVVIARDEFRSVVGMFEDYFSAKEVFEQKSLLAGKLGEQIASPKFQLIDDPMNMAGTGVRPFDAEGAYSRKTVLFENGIVKNYLTNLEYAQKMNLPHTAHAARGPSSQMNISPSNLVVGLGQKSLAELVSAKGQVVFVTHFAGSLHSGFKESTGDFSIPAEGLLYENGQCIGPVDQFVLSGNVLELLRDIEDLGNEYSKSPGSILCPDVLVKSLSVAGA